MSTGEFRLRGCLVRPHLNRLALGEGCIHRRHGLPDVFALLARNRGEVVSRDTDIASFRAEPSLAESVFGPSIAKRRQTLEGDHAQAQFIEAVNKGGDRLAAAVERLGRPASATRPEQPGAARNPRRSAKTPVSSTGTGGRSHGRRGRNAAANQRRGRAEELCSCLRPPRGRS